MKIAIAAALSACGGSTDTANNSHNAKDLHLKASMTVPGTVIEAYCDDGQFSSTDSINDASGKNPLALELPQDLTCRAVMITDEDDDDEKAATIS